MPLSFIDQMGLAITIKHPPRRIVSLVPSQTELLHALKLDQEVVGITKFCIHPQNWHNQKQHVGGTKHFDFSIIDRLEPDLIIGNKEENYEEGIQRLKEKYPVWISDINNLEDAQRMILAIGQLTDREVTTRELVERINNNFSSLVKKRNERVLYLIWRKPWMAAGKNTFIDDMLTRVGFVNVVQANRYPEISESDIEQLKPDYILLSSEPYPFKAVHAEEVAKIGSGTKVLFVDGEMFSWYGSRLLYSCDYFKTIGY